MSRIARGIAWAIFCIRIFLLDPLEFLRAHSINDYASFHAAAVAIVEGLNPYDTQQLQAAARSTGLPGVHPYFYPPALAELLLPFTLLEPFSARMVWWALTAAAITAVVWLLDRHLRDTLGDRAEPARIAFLFFCAMMWPIRASQWMSQVNSIVLLLLVLWYTRRETAKWAGALLGVAAAIKMSPALLVLVPLSQKRWREAGVAIGTGAGIVILSCALIGARGLHFFTDVLFGFVPGRQYHDLGVPIPLTGNHSVAAFVYWIVDQGRSLEVRKLSSRATLLQLSILAVMFAAWVVRAPKVDADSRLAALMVLMIVAPTFAFEHHVVFALLPIALVIGMLAEGRFSRWWTVAAVAALAPLVEHETVFMPPAGRYPRILNALVHGPLLVPMVVLAAVALAAKPVGVRVHAGD